LVQKIEPSILVSLSLYLFVYLNGLPYFSLKLTLLHPVFLLRRLLPFILIKPLMFEIVKHSHTLALYFRSHATLPPQLGSFLTLVFHLVLLEATLVHVDQFLVDFSL